MIRRSVAVASGVGLVLLASGLWADAQEVPMGPPGPHETAEVLREALRAQVTALNHEDVDKVMAGFHPHAYGREEARKNLVHMFRLYDMRYDLAEFSFIGEDERYAYARAVQVTRTQSGVDRTEQIFVFRRAGKGWAFWTSAVLDKLPVKRKN